MNPYKIDTSNENLIAPFAALEVLYESMPETTGCEKCQEVNGENRQWCCKKLSPSMFYVEFLKVWKTVQNAWSKKKRIELFIRAISNYLSRESEKGCIFLVDGQCTCYKERPLYCRLYGVIPEISWRSKVETAKKLNPKFVDRPQCNLVRFVNEKDLITEEMENKWFARIQKLEKRIGIKNKTIQLHDLPGGSYRTFHDHIMLEFPDVKTMNTLTKIKMTNPSKEDIQAFVEILSKQLESSDGRI